MKPKKESGVAVIFLVMIAVILVLIVSDARSIRTSILADYLKNRPQTPTFMDKTEIAIDSAEGEVCKSADRFHLFIELNGGFQRLLGKRVIDDMVESSTVVKLGGGNLNFALKGAAFFDNADCAEQLVALRDKLASQDIPLLYVQAPQKSEKGQNRMPLGVAEFGNEQADRLLELIQEQGMESIDLRETFAAADGAYESYFFRTDHHWKPEGAFLGFQAVCQRLETEYGFEIPDDYLDLENYNCKVYKDYFLGSQGKRVGTLYAGVDDISLISPQFETDLTFEIPSAAVSRTGTFLETVIDYTKIDTKDYYNNNPYAMYTGGDFPLNIIRNNLNPEGKRVLLIRDSFSCAFAPFFALACGELDIVDLRHFSGSLRDYIEKTQPDLVMVLYTTGTTANRSMFQMDS